MKGGNEKRKKLREKKSRKRNVNECQLSLSTNDSKPLKQYHRNERTHMCPINI